MILFSSSPRFSPRNVVTDGITLNAARHAARKQTMKDKITPPAFYQWSQAKDAADKLATWTYTNLIKPESPHAKTYPLNGASSTLLLDGSWGLTLPRTEEAMPTTEPADSIQVSPHPKELLEAAKVRQQLEEIAAIVACAC